VAVQTDRVSDILPFNFGIPETENRRKLTIDPRSPQWIFSNSRHFRFPTSKFSGYPAFAFWGQSFCVSFALFWPTAPPPFFFAPSARRLLRWRPVLLRQLGLAKSPKKANQARAVRFVGGPDNKSHTLAQSNSRPLESRSPYYSRGMAKIFRNVEM
jgi:hypothetical protein